MQIPAVLPEDDLDIHPEDTTGPIPPSGLPAPDNDADTHPTPSPAVNLAH